MNEWVVADVVSSSSIVVVVIVVAASARKLLVNGVKYSKKIEILLQAIQSAVLERQRQQQHDTNWLGMNALYDDGDRRSTTTAAYYNYLSFTE